MNTNMVAELVVTALSSKFRQIHCIFSTKTMLSGCYRYSENASFVLF